MQKRDRRSFLSLAIPLCIGFLCLAQTACKTTPINPQHKNDNKKTTKSKKTKKLNKPALSSSIESNEFKVVLKKGNYPQSKNHFVFVHITPGSSGMKLEECFITASVTGGQDKLKAVGNRGKPNKRLQYNKSLSNNKLNLKELYVISSNCIGSRDTTFEEGKQVTFKIRCSPNTSQEEYILTVTVNREGSKPQTETLDLNKKDPPG